jgi:hypothetical protein
MVLLKFLVLMDQELDKLHHQTQVQLMEQDQDIKLHHQTIFKDINHILINIQNEIIYEQFIMIYKCKFYFF